MKKYLSQEQYNELWGYIERPWNTIPELQENVNQGFNNIFSSISWPRWFEINEIDSIASQVFWEKANHLEIPSKYLTCIKNWEFSPLSLVRICREDEGVYPNSSQTRGVRITQLPKFLLQKGLDITTIDATIEKIFSSDFSRIEIYPHRLQNKKDFRSVLAHEMTHFFLDIKLIIKAFEKWMTPYYFFKKYFLQWSKYEELRAYVHEATAWREWAHSLANIDSAYGVQYHSWKEYFDAWENSNYANGAKMGYLMHTMQNKIWNQMGLGAVKKYCQEKGIEFSLTTNYQQFDKWCIKIQNYLEEGLFDDRYLQRLKNLLEYYHQQDDLMPFVEWGQDYRF